MSVKAKKHLGQHFLTDLSICKRIADSVQCNGAYTKALEIGPGMGALTQFLLKNPAFETHVIEIDPESVEYLESNFEALENRIYSHDFLKVDLSSLFHNEPFGLIGNFPYNISSQIVFKLLDHIDVVPEMVGMFQKEVAERICSGPGSKAYGILSVLCQTYYECEYLFTVDETVFNPPPKVKSGVMRMWRKPQEDLPISYVQLKMVVKLAFNQRRKTIRNSLKSITPEGFDHPFFTKRPEQLSYKEFIELAHSILTQA